MGLIDWTPSEANVVLADADEGYVSTLEIAPIVDGHGNAIKTSISRRGGQRITAPMYEAVSKPSAPELIQSEKPRRFRAPWLRKKEAAPQAELPSIPQQIQQQPIPRYTPKPVQVKPTAPKPPVESVRPKTQIERLYPRNTPTPKPTAPAVTEPAPEFRPLP